jgi:hypothetical protein
MQSSFMGGTRAARMSGSDGSTRRAALGRNGTKKMDAGLEQSAIDVV